ncbi:Presequence protease, mitochondrial [Cichlidogyrus casuarinus]|uniref:Presequence protease, mitochondrial n=1 Tax=Cichlidogyrus casuarinus TaxID=1844966 RepID=A0ABD2Q2I7_9PLAT
MLVNKLQKLAPGSFKYGYVLKNNFLINEFRMRVFEFVHESSGASHLHFARDDRNKCFAAHFRTMPPDNSGVPHILEHTVLCGSQKFPVRDPFFKMLRRSQATFMNAMTASDSTMYPFATMNDTDYFNLLASSSVNCLARDIQRHLLPQTYAHDSGGIPLEIPSLTWEQLQGFHRQLYHPRNCTVLTYGDMDVEPVLQFVSSQYLTPCPPVEVPAYMGLEPAWTKPRELHLQCQPDPMNAFPERPCLVALSYRIGDSRDIYESFKMQILSQLLISGENAPLYQGLIIQERVEAVLHAFEVGLRHESSDFGMRLLMNLFYPLAHGVTHQLESYLQVQAKIDWFKQDYEKDPDGFFNELIDRHLLNNPHRLLSVMRPAEGHKDQLARQEQQLLDRTVAQLSPDQRSKYITNCQQLQQKQAQEQDTSLLPCLRLQDIPKEAVREPFQVQQQVHLNEAPTNGLLYLHMLIPLDTLDPQLLPYVPLFAQLFTQIGAQGMDYLQFAQAEELVCTGISCRPHLHSLIDPVEGIQLLDRPVKALHLSTSCLARNIDRTFDLMGRMFKAPDWTDRPRILQLTQMAMASDWSADALAHNAHRYALDEASSALNATSSQSNRWSGLSQARFMLGPVARQVESELDHLVQQMQLIWRHVNCNTDLRMSLHGGQDELSIALPIARQEKGGAYGGNVGVSSGKFSFTTYRDPSASRSLRAFESGLQWAAEKCQFTDQDLLEAKLSQFQQLDRPVSAGARGSRAFLSNYTDQLVQQHRDRLFGVNGQQVREAARDLLHKSSASSTDRFDCILGPRETAHKEHLSEAGWTIESIFSIE